ncbi:MAG: alpha-amylase family glycosyl hydrolase [Chloroflexi bacterium]|nr:alpha-amylase family glycosyl hydrolase [Chloroflexota bacterium]
MPFASVPLATYRLQFNLTFRIGDAAKLLPYLDTLGVSHVYASPILRARAGSTHGYDGIDPTRVGLETGGTAGLRRLAKGLRQRGMGLVLDIVPNHLAASTENPWWHDVLEGGLRSPKARLFDIRWTEGNGRVTLPVLGQEYPDALVDGRFSVGIGPDGLSLRYGGMQLPLRSASYMEILQRARDRLIAGPAMAIDTIQAGFSSAVALAEAGEHARAAPVALHQTIWRLYDENTAVRNAIDAELAAFDGWRGDGSQL